MSALPSWVERYRGRPFERGADGPAAFDCYGLVRAVLCDQWGLDTPALDGAWHLEAAASLYAALHAPDCPWVGCEGSPLVGDVLTFGPETGAGELHVAIVVADGWVLHATRERGVETARLDRVSMACTRIGPVWRHRGLVAQEASR